VGSVPCELALLKQFEHIHKLSIALVIFSARPAGLSRIIERGVKRRGIPAALLAVLDRGR